MNEALIDQIRNLKPVPKKKAVQNFKAFLAAYGEVQAGKLFGSEDKTVVLQLEHDDLMEIAFTEEGCVILLSFGPVESYTPEALARQLRPKIPDGMATFEIGPILDSMDVWEEQIKLGGEMHALIEKHKLWEQVPGLKKLSNKWKKIEKSMSKE